ncbi:MAG: hypothetical protein J0H41_18060 [Rhizobiales bacterium]|nr:hypothetical protein [Hyphomicrobiales bacterium]
MALHRNTLVILLALACIVIAALGFKMYRDEVQEPGVQINVGPRGLSIEQK